jgi:hypothetical protein
LKRFQKVYLNPGDTTHVQFLLDAPSLSYWDITTHNWLVAPGAYQIMVGSSSRDTRLKGRIVVAMPSPNLARTQAAASQRTEGPRHLIFDGLNKDTAEILLNHDYQAVSGTRLADGSR